MYAMYLGSTPAVVRSDADRDAIGRADLDAATGVVRRTGEADLVVDLIARIRGAIGLRRERVDACACAA